MKMKKIGIALAAALTVGLVGGSFAKEQLSSELPLSPIINERVEGLLLLNRQQEQALTQVRGHSAHTFDVLESRLTSVRQAMDEELAKEAPDFRKVSELGVAARAEIIAAVTISREARLQFYEGMSLSQKAIIRAEMKERLQRFDRAKAVLFRIFKANSV